MGATSSSFSRFERKTLRAGISVVDGTAPKSERQNTSRGALLSQLRLEIRKLIAESSTCKVHFPKAPAGSSQLLTAKVFREDTFRKVATTKVSRRQVAMLRSENLCQELDWRISQGNSRQQLDRRNMLRDALLMLLGRNIF